MNSSVNNKTLIFSISIAVIIVFTGCSGITSTTASKSTAPTTEDSAVLNVIPEIVVMKMPDILMIEFQGKGFDSQDRVEISLEKADKGEDVPLAFGEADQQGEFKVSADKLSVLQGILHLRFREGKPVPVGVPPLKPGKYTVKASSWDSKKVARSVMELAVPTIQK